MIVLAATSATLPQTVDIAATPLLASDSVRAAHGTGSRWHAGVVQPSDWITFAAVAVAVIATVPAYLSLRITKAAADAAVTQTALQRAIAHEARLPMLWADVRPHPEQRQVMCLFVGNTGPTTGHDVTVTIEPRILPGPSGFACDAGQDAAAAGIAALPPGRTLEWALGVGSELVSVPGQPAEFTVTVAGRASDGTPVTETFKSRLDDIRNTRATAGNLEDLAQQARHGLAELRRLNRAVERLADRVED